MPYTYYDRQCNNINVYKLHLNDGKNRFDLFCNFVVNYDANGSYIS